MRRSGGRKARPYKKLFDRSCRGGDFGELGRAVHPRPLSGLSEDRQQIKEESAKNQGGIVLIGVMECWISDKYAETTEGSKRHRAGVKPAPTKCGLIGLVGAGFIPARKASKGASAEGLFLNYKMHPSVFCAGCCGPAFIDGAFLAETDRDETIPVDAFSN